MAKTTEAQQQLAELLDERTQRTSAAEAARRAKQDATARLAKLRTQRALDNAATDQRIAAAEQEIAAANDAIIVAAGETLAIWPDVSAELERRIVAAQEALHEAQTAEKRAELQSIMAGEKARRLAFAETLHAFAQVGFDLRTMLRRKQQLKMELFEVGVIIDAGSDQFDHWPSHGIGESVAIDMARDLMSKYGG